MIAGSQANGQNDRLAAALKLAESGLQVFPTHSVNNNTCTCGKPDCPSPGKHPRTTHGFHEATCDPEQITTWWSRWPTANVAIRTGRESEVFVLDIDGADGESSLAAFVAQHGKLPTTPVAQTGRGQHYYFTLPTKSVLSRAGVAPGVDVRGDGGYVIAPPSIHARGCAYSWLVSPEEQPFAAAPAWLLDLVSSATGSDSCDNATPNTATTLTVGATSFASAGGVPEGRRRQELCRLVGAHLARGETTPDILPLAFRWAATCTPTLPPTEVTQAVVSLAAKHHNHRLSVEPEFDEEPLPPPRPWPALPDAAMHGLAGRIVARLLPHTEADPAALLGQLLTVFGSVIGRSPHMMADGARHGTNLFMVLVGDSSSSRKGTSLKRVQQCFPDSVDATWSTNCQQSGLSSGEGLIWHVRDAISKQEPIRSAGQITGYETEVVDPGVCDKRLLVVESEYVRVLTVAKRESNTLSAILRQAWDGERLRTMTKNTPAVSTDPHISVIGHITPHELCRSLDATEAANGFANRFLFLVLRRSKYLPHGGGQPVLQDLIEELAEAVAFGRAVSLVQRDADANAIWAEHYPRLVTPPSGLQGAITGRAAPQVLRLSLLYALLDKSNAVRPAHLRAALAFWDYCFDSAKYIFGWHSGNQLADRILAEIRERPGLTRAEISKRLSGHSSKEALVLAFSLLRDDGHAHPRRESTGGRPRERWFPGRADCEVVTALPAEAAPDDLSPNISHISPIAEQTDAVASPTPATVQQPSGEAVEV